MWEHPRTQPVHTKSAVAQSHYSACYWTLSHSAAQHWISQPQPAVLLLRGIDWLLDFPRCSSHTLSLSLTLLPSIVLTPLCTLSIFPLSHPLPTSLSLASLSLSPRLPSVLPLSLPLPRSQPLFFFLLDNRKPYLAVCSAPPWQSCQFTCLDCRILYLVSKTHCNYNPCINKCTWYTAISDQHPVSYPHLSQTLYSTWFHNQQTQPFKCKKTAITCHCLLNRCVREKCTLGGSEQQTRLGSWSISECRCYTLNNAGLCIESI